MVTSWFRILVGIALFLGTQIASGLELNVDDAGSIQQAASKVANGMMNYYKGNEYGGTPGVLPEPYYWWEVGSSKEIIYRIKLTHSGRCHVWCLDRLLALYR
jgi:hypothetical protein